MAEGWILTTQGPKFDAPRTQAMVSREQIASRSAQAANQLAAQQAQWENARTMERERMAQQMLMQGGEGYFKARSAGGVDRYGREVEGELQRMAAARASEGREAGRFGLEKDRFGLERGRFDIDKEKSDYAKTLRSGKEKATRAQLRILEAEAGPLGLEAIGQRQKTTIAEGKARAKTVGELADMAVADARLRLLDLKRKGEAATSPEQIAANKEQLRNFRAKLDEQHHELMQRKGARRTPKEFRTWTKNKRDLEDIIVSNHLADQESLRDSFVERKELEQLLRTMKLARGRAAKVTPEQAKAEARLTNSIRLNELKIRAQQLDKELGYMNDPIAVSAAEEKKIRAMAESPEFAPHLLREIEEAFFAVDKEGIAAFMDMDGEWDKSKRRSALKLFTELKKGAARLAARHGGTKEQWNKVIGVALTQQGFWTETLPGLKPKDRSIISKNLVSELYGGPRDATPVYEFTDDAHKKLFESSRSGRLGVTEPSREVRRAFLAEVRKAREGGAVIDMEWMQGAMEGLTGERWSPGIEWRESGQSPEGVRKLAQQWQSFFDALNNFKTEGRNSITNVNPHSVVAE